MSLWVGNEQAAVRRGHWGVQLQLPGLSGRETPRRGVCLGVSADTI